MHLFDVETPACIIDHKGLHARIFGAQIRTWLSFQCIVTLNKIYWRQFPWPYYGVCS